MRIPECASTVIGILVLALTLPAAAHHGAAGQFYETRTAEVRGTVKEWSFVNPHPVLLLEVTDADGQIEVWDVFFGPQAAASLRNRGYAADTFEIGETVIVIGHLATADGVRGIDVFRGASRVTREDGSPIP